MLPDNLKPFVPLMLAVARKQFPRSCPACHRRYEDFEQYVRETSPMGTTLGYPFDPMGMIAWVRCACGYTLTLNCEEITGLGHRQFVQALKNESDAGGLSTEALMAEIRDEVRRSASSRP